MAVAALRGLSIPALLAPLLSGLALAIPLGAGSPAAAIPRLDLNPYPAPAAGVRRWVIQLPGVLPPSRDSDMSASPSDWRVELIIGRELEVDCNKHQFAGKLSSESLKGWGYKIYRVSEVGPMVSTRMACPPGTAKKRAFVTMGRKPFVVSYNASLPIVVYAPQELELRWRLWKAENKQRLANSL